MDKVSPLIFLWLCLYFPFVLSSEPALGASTSSATGTSSLSQAPQRGVSLPPKMNNKPLAIEVTFFVIDISSINIRNMDFRVDYYLKERWEVPNITCTTYITKLRKADVNTSRDALGSVFISPKHVKLIWWPDTLITNAKLIAMPSKVLKFAKMKMTLRGSRCSMQHVSKLTAVISCQMELRNYPMDLQKCPLLMRSFSYPADLVQYKWREKVGIKDGLKVSQYNLASVTNGSLVADALGDKFSYITVEFVFERNIAHNIIHTYVPSFLLVILSWFSFWMGLDAIPGRITLSVTSLLALVTQFSSMRKELPPVAYINGSDLWMVMCMMFVFASLFEFSVIKFMDHQFKKQMKRMRKKGVPLNGERGLPPPLPPPPYESLAFPGNVSQRNEDRAALEVRSLDRSWRDFALQQQLRINRIDRSSRWMFPATYFLWNAIYWPMLLFRKF